MPESVANAHLAAWQHREALAEAAVPLIGSLYRDHACVVEVFGASLVQKTPVQILTIVHEKAQRYNKPLPMEQVHGLIAFLAHRTPGRARIDIGKLLLQFRESGGSDLAGWAAGALEPLVSSPKELPEEAQDVVLYGFGRIGRLMARILVNKTGGGDKYRLRAIVLRRVGPGDLERRASLLRRDSVHGVFPGTVEVDEERQALIVNGNMILVLTANSPNEVDYATHGIDNAIVIDNTGMWRDQKGLSLHLQSPGAAKVVLTAPGKDIPNIVYGVNHSVLSGDEQLVSAASCTTNAIVPVLQAVDAAWGIRHGHLETIHAYTNDQNLIDNFHKKDRRGRAAALNMVITSTGAAKAVAKALPSLAGKLTGSAIRVPTPNVSLAILNLQLDATVTREEVNDHLRNVAMDGPLHAQIGFSVSPEAVSSDLVGDHHAGTVDSVATVADQSSVVLYVWYDNEYGYSCQVMRLVQEMAGASPRHFPA